MPRPDFCALPLGARRRLFVVAALVVILPSGAHAQSGQTGILQGRATIPAGRVVANATVELRRADGSYPRTARTAPSGDYRINFITPGTYNVTVRLIGYQPVVYSGVVIGAAEVQTLDVVLTPSRTALDTLAITAGTSLINTSTTEFTSSIGSRERELLPTSRDANGLIGLTPGVRPGQIFGGSTDQANLYQLDGVTVNQPGSGGSFLLPNVDWIEDFKVIGLGAGAEYGNFQGGLVNIVTKSGSNTMQAQVRTFYENRTLNASNVNAFESGAELDGRVEVNAELRGPLIRDKLYFYLSGSEARSNTRVVDFSNAAADNVIWLGPLAERQEQKYYGKLTWQATPRDIINASLGVDNVVRERAGLSGYDAVETTVQGRSPSAFYQANWQRTIDNRSYFELKLSGYRGEDNELPYNGSDFPGVRLLDAPNAPQFANAFYTSRNAPSSIGLSGMYDLYASAGRVQHNIKMGGELVLGSWKERRTRNGGLSWYTEAGAGFDPLVPATWQEIPSIGVYATADTGGQIDLDASTRNAAFYVQDYMRVGDRLTVSAGLRLGLWQGFLTPGFGRGDRIKAINAQGLDPRVGASFDLSGDETLVAKAHWGRFHQNLFALFFDRAPGANVFTNIEFCDWNNTDKTVLPELGRQYTPAEFNALFTCFAGANLFTEAQRFEDYKQPYMDQITLGIEKAIGRHLKAEALYVNRRNKAVLSLVDKNVDRNWSPITNVRVRDAGGAVQTPDGGDVVLPVVYVRNDDLVDRLRAGDVIPGYVASDSLRLGYDPALVIRPVDGAQRAFDQVQLSLSGVWPRVSFNAAVAFTNLTGNLFSVNGYFNPSGQENGPFVEPNGAINYQGNLPNYSPWDVKARVSGALPWGFEGGAFLTYQAGDYWTPNLSITRQLDFTAGEGAAAVALDDDLFLGTAGQSLFTESRGSRTFDAVANLDVRLQRVLTLGRNDLIVGLEVFNVFNGSAVTDTKRSLNSQDAADPTSLAGAVRFRQPPMTVRLNVQYRY